MELRNAIVEATIVYIELFTACRLYSVDCLRTVVFGLPAQDGR